MTRMPFAAAGMLAILLTAAPAGHALPQRSLVARPLPPAVLAAAGSDAAGPTLGPESARALTDSLLQTVSAVRGLRALRPVPVRLASRPEMRARLEEIARADAIDANLRRDEKLLEFLGLVPPALDLVGLYHDLLEEQLAGFYDIDRRELVLANWLPREHQIPVLHHELTHALQDQHFSLRVRKRLGFDSADAEAAWNALLEGDATAVMAEVELRATGRPFTALFDSAETVKLAPPAARAAAGGLDSERFRNSPPVVREELAFPYVEGLRYVAERYRWGGWKGVDAAYVHPPASTEQVLHANRIDNSTDAPVRVTIPDLRGLLGEAYGPETAGTLGEQELYRYLAHWVEPEVAAVAAEGWGGCAYTLYEGAGDGGAAFVMASVWDSADDAVEFFGGLIGALEARYPRQVGDAETSTQDQVIWRVAGPGQRVNALRIVDRQVICLEGAPEARLPRILAKLEGAVRVDDPAPEVRANDKANLPWNRKAAPLAAGARRPQVELPEGWNAISPGADPSVVLEAQHGTARLRVVVDRGASRERGLDGYAHEVAARIQAAGHDVYVQKDTVYPRGAETFYQHVFAQTEGTTQVVHYLGVADLGQGLGYLALSGPVEDQEQLEQTFYEFLGALELVPETRPATATPGVPEAQPGKG